jgi:hypothetical protein
LWFFHSNNFFLLFRHFGRISAKTRTVGFRPKIGLGMGEFRPNQPKIDQFSMKSSAQFWPKFNCAGFE